MNKCKCIKKFFECSENVMYDYRIRDEKIIIVSGIHNNKLFEYRILIKNFYEYFVDIDTLRYDKLRELHD
jgi:hypothetical protein